VKVHPSAVISPTATLGSDVSIGPFCVVEDDAVIGDGCALVSHAIVGHQVVLGPGNTLLPGVVVGGPPQHVRAGQALGSVAIGEGNTLRENVTIHRSLQPGHCTTLGDGNYIMINAHVAHDCQIGDHTIVANNVMLAGHVVIEDRAFLSGAAGVHQFCRVGRLALVGGQAHLTQDVPPFVLIDGVSTSAVGLNRVGLRRAGYTPADIAQLKAAYQLIYRSGLPWREVLVRLQDQFAAGPAAAFYEFLSTSTRGFVHERRLPPGATIKLHQAPDESSDEAATVAKAG